LFVVDWSDGRLKIFCSGKYFVINSFEALQATDRARLHSALPDSGQHGQRSGANGLGSPSSSLFGVGKIAIVPVAMKLVQLEIERGQFCSADFYPDWGFSAVINNALALRP